MNSHHKYLLSACLIIVTVLVVIYVIYWEHDVQAQTSCCDPARLSALAGKFPAGAHVTVTLSTALTEAERDDIIAGIQEWNSHNVTNQSAVVYGPFLIGDTPIHQANNQFVGYQDPLPGACAQEHVNTSSTGTSTDHIRGHVFRSLYEDWVFS
jgi:hypothetical protein